MTTRDDLVAQVEQAIKDVPFSDPYGPLSNEYFAVLANAAVDQFAIFFYELLAQEKQ